MIGEKTDTFALTSPDELAACGVRIHGDAAVNQIQVAASLLARKEVLDVFLHGVGNSLTLRDGCTASGRVVFTGDGAEVSIGGFAHHNNLDVWMYTGSKFHWGDRSVSYGVRAWVDGGVTMSVGDDCLFSEGIQMRTSDHHSLIDLTTMAQINFPADLTVGRHVWVGPGVSILKGVSIDDGSVVGAASVVTQSIGRTELWVGTPARRLRGNVSWVDTHPANPAQIEGLATMGLVRSDVN